MSQPRQPPGDAAPRLELRIERGRVRIGLSPGAIGPGLALLDLEMEPAALPGPFDPGAGTAPFRSVACSLRRLVVEADGTPPGPDALAEVLAAALGPSGWPLPDAAGLVHSPVSGGARPGASWLLPADATAAALRLAREGLAREEIDAPLRLAEAGHAALAAGESAAGEAALRDALAHGLGRDDAREAWTALVASARAAGDPVAERTALAGLASAAPTGERPALLLRLSALDLEAGDPVAARLHAEDARRLAPRDAGATEVCLAAARRAGDVAATVELLDRLALLDPASAGERLLERARLLASAGQLAEADLGYADALSRLPADRALADEHAALRRGAPGPVGRHPWGEPLETFAARVADGGEAARALKDAAMLARAQGDLASALRAARRAHERSGDVAFAGELLAGLLHAGGSVTEALDVHRRLLAEAAPSLSPEGLSDRLTALAELAEEAGDRRLAMETLDRLLAERPHDAGLLEWRFRVDPDRAGALDRLVAGAAEVRSRQARARLLSVAADAARDESRDPDRERALLRQAADAAAGVPAAEREVGRRLLSLCRAAPADAESARILESVLDRDPRARADAFLSIAEAAPNGRVRAAHLKVAAAALAETGEAIRQRETLRAAFESWPADGETYRGALAWAEGDVEATDAILASRAVAAPEEAASCHRIRAELLLAAGHPGPASRAFEAGLASDPLDGGALEGLAEARTAEGDLPGALAAARRAAEVAVSQGRTTDRRRVLERGAHLAGQLGDRGDDARAVLESLAVVLLDAGEPATPGLAEVVTRAAAALEAAGEELRGASLRSRAGLAPHPPQRASLDEPSGTPGDAPGAPGARIAELLRPLLVSARALADTGELGAAYARLKLAREIDPEHLDLTLMLARVAEKLGHLEEAVSLGEAWAEAASRTDPAGAAARYRELAAVARNRLSDVDRAAALLGKAVALEPDDPATAAALTDLRESRRDQALEVLGIQLGILRERPSAQTAARAVAVLSRELGAGAAGSAERAARAERAGVADDLARFAQQLGPSGRPFEPAFGLDARLRSRVALPGADGSTARLLALLAPHLEPLFPVDLARHGVGPGERPPSSPAPAVQRAFGEAFRALGGRQLALLASQRPGLLATVENTRPPSVILGADVAALPPGALAFLAARSVALASSGWALLGRFSPRDTLILCELAIRFAGAHPPPRGLPPGPAAAFLAALERSVPRATREEAAPLGLAAAEELGTLEPVAFAGAIEDTASRLALLHAGDLLGALGVLSRLRRPGVVSSADPAATLDRPDLAGLARFALSDAYLEHRGMLLGWT